LKGSGVFGLGGDHNDVATLAADVHGQLSFRDLNDLTVGTVGQVKGINTNNHRVRLDAGESLIIGSGAGEDIDAGGGKVILKGDDGVREETGSGIVTNEGVGLLGQGTFDLTRSDNKVKSLLAEIDGNLDFRASGALTIIKNGEKPGISTHGGNVKITTGGILTVEGKVSTGPGSGGGELTIIGNPNNVLLEAKIEVGKGTVTFVVPVKPPPQITAQAVFLNRMSRVLVRDAATRKLRAVLTPFVGFRGVLHVRLRDLNGDGSADPIVWAVINGKVFRKVYDAHTLHRLA
jgi:hypothetical protein